jgi:hypothetical protein
MRRPFRRNQMGSVKIERVSAHQRADHRVVHVGASGDILGDPPCNFSRFSTPEHPFYLARPGPQGTLNSTAKLSLFLRRPISHQCQQERLQRAGVQLRKIHHSPPFSPLSLSLSLSSIPSSGVSCIRVEWCGVKREQATKETEKSAMCENRRRKVEGGLSGPTPRWTQRIAITN